MNYFILTVGDSFNNNIKIDPFIEFKKRIDENYWYLYLKTNHAYRMNVNDKVLFYVSGPNNNKIFGRAIIENKNNNPKLRPDSYTYNEPIFELTFKDIKLFNEPKLMVEKIAQTEFFLNSSKKNIKKWGVFLMGGVRRVSKTDFDYLCK